MTTKQIKDALCERYGFTKARAKEITDSFARFIQAGLAHEGVVRLDGVGTFTVVTRAARKSRNPRTGEVVNVPEKLAVRFKASKKLL